MATTPRLMPPSGAPRHLVMFLHGYGADGNDLIEIGRVWQSVLPDAAFAAPHAPRPCGMGGPGREWFPLTFRDPHERWRGVAMAMPGLVQTIGEELGRLHLTMADLALVGFSQGTMMALHAGLRLPERPAAILGFSGLLVGPEGQKPETMAPDIRQRPPVLLVHGTDDDVIPAAALFQSANGLSSLDIPVEWHLSPGIGHGIDEEGLYHGAHFLERAFTKPSSSR